MSKEQMIATIVVAIIGAIGASIGGGFAFAQFLIKTSVTPSFRHGECQ